MYTHTCVYIYIYIHTYIHAYINKNIYIYIYIQDGCAAIIDSGTSLIAAPGYALMQLSEMIPEIKEVAHTIYIYIYICVCKLHR